MPRTCIDVIRGGLSDRENAKAYFPRMAYVLNHLLWYRGIHKNRYNSKQSFIPMDSRILDKIIGKDHRRKVLDRMIEL